MAIAVVSGASAQCTMGASLQLMASQQTVLLGGKPCLNTTDVSMGSNLIPAGVCSSMANPAVASATAAALGVLTPQPCTPTPAGIWQCGCQKMIGGKPALTNDGMLVCAYGGSISITYPGQDKAML